MESLLSKFVSAWEYKRFSQNSELYESDLNRLGNEGWELVSHSTPGTYHYYIFKRRKFPKNQD